MDKKRNWLLLPKQFNDDYSWMFRLGDEKETSPLHNVQVMALKIEDMRGIDIFLRNTSRALAKEKQTPEIKRSIKMTEWMRSFVGNRAHQKPVPPAIVEAINKAARTRVSANDMIYLVDIPDTPIFPR